MNTPATQPRSLSSFDSLTAIGLLMLGAALSPAASGQTTAELEEVRASIERQRQAVELLEAEIEKDPGQAPLWEAWIMQRSMLSTVEDRLAVAEGAPESTREEREARARRRVEVLYSKWIESVPGDPTPWIQRAVVLFPKDGREEALRDVVERFPESFAPTKRLAAHLRYLDRVAEELALLEEFVAAGTGDADAYPVMHRRYSETGADEKARQLAERWLAELPADPEANRVAYLAESQGRSPADRRALARQRMDRLEPLDRAEWCPYLGGRDESAHAAVSDCYAAVLDQLPQDSESYATTFQKWTELAARSEEGAGIDQLLEDLAPERQDTVRRAIARDRVSEGRCDEAAALVRATSEPYGALQSLSWSVRYDRCARSTAMREMVLEAAARAEPDDLESMLRERGGDLPVEEIEAVLLARLEEDSDPKLWRALDHVYDQNGEISKRTRHLERWLAAGTDRPAHYTLELAGLLLSTGQLDRAQGLLTSATLDPDMPFDYQIWETLAEIHFLSGSPDQAQQVGQRLLAGNGPRAFYGHLLLARSALALQRTDEALGHYERFFEQAPGEFWRRADEYRDLLVLQGEHDPLERFLERRWEAERDASYYEQGRRELWVAESLAEVGLYERALGHYEKLVAEGEVTKEILTEIARLAEDLEEWERAETARRKLLELAPRESASWVQLARHLLERGEPERAFDELERAFEQVDRPEPRLWIAWADAVMALDAGSDEGPSAERLVEAIDVLEQAREVYGDQIAQAPIHTRLDELYRRLGALPN